MMNVERVKLGALSVNRNTWVREKISLDQVRCLVNDLVNGHKLPPLLVEKNTMTIVGGNHRFLAYQKFFGDKWADQEVDVVFIELPPYEVDPIAWKVAALSDNDHRAERLKYGDRNKVARELLRLGLDPESDLANEVAERLHFTREGWREFVRVYLGAIAKDIFEAERMTPRPTPDGPHIVCSLPGKAKKPSKSPLDDIQPPDGKIGTLRNRLLNLANSLIDVLLAIPTEGLRQREREILKQLMEVVERRLAEGAA